MPFSTAYTNFSRFYTKHSAAFDDLDNDVHRRDGVWTIEPRAKAAVAAKPPNEGAGDPGHPTALWQAKAELESIVRLRASG
jgi:hypothetical protein